MQNNSQYFNNSIFWIETEKIVPNPYQPRREFDQAALKDLSDSIRMYGLLQPIVVTRKESIREDGGLSVQYELISGERRLRASKLAGLQQIPVIIRSGEEDPRVKLELAIIENLQREDLNAVDRARSFQRLSDEFGLKHVQIAEKVGKSREYVTNSIRLLALPEHILQALSEKRISEGHTRPFLMLVGRSEEQEVLFREIVTKKITVREAESIARKVATDRVRKKEYMPDPELVELEGQLNEALGTRVHIERREVGGKVVIDFFNNDDLHHIIALLNEQKDQLVKKTEQPLQVATVSQPNIQSSTEGVTDNNRQIEIQAEELPSYQPQYNLPEIQAVELTSPKLTVASEENFVEKNTHDDVSRVIEEMTSRMIQEQGFIDGVPSSSASAAESVAQNEPLQAPKDSSSIIREIETVHAALPKATPSLNLSASFSGIKDPFEDFALPVLPKQHTTPIDDSTSEDEMYAIKNFSL